MHSLLLLSFVFQKDLDASTLATHILVYLVL